MYNGCPNNPYFDPSFPFFMMMMNQKHQKEEDPADIIKRYEALKKAFEPPKKDDKKDNKKWETLDYFTFIIALIIPAIGITTWMIISKIVELVAILHQVAK